MTAINLSKGLEALFYFDEQNFDNQRNQIRDHSGYGRHATASGGPTVGVEGPASFEATSFDGTDDKFVVPNNLAGPNEQTVYALAKIGNTSNSNESIIETTDGTDGWRLRAFDNDIVWAIQDGASNKVSTVWNGYSADVYYSIFGVWDGNQLKLIVDDQLKDITSVSTHNESTNNAKIGTQLAENTFYDGDIAAVGHWTRALSDAEISQLNRLTAPRRAQL